MIPHRKVDPEPGETPEQKIAIQALHQLALVTNGIAFSNSARSSFSGAIAGLPGLV
jgi:hypothetical protein